MRYYFLILSIIVTLLSHQSVAEGKLFGNIQPGGVITASLASPSTGQVVQGSVVIRGSTVVDGFKSEVVDITYSGDPTSTRLLLQETTIPVQDGILAVWDSNTIIDGDYNLRHLISKVDGNQSEVMVTGLRVRNHLHIEINPPSPPGTDVTLGSETITYTSSDQETLPPVEASLLSTPTPLPANPAEVTASQVAVYFGFGAALSLSLLVLLGAYAGLRSFLKGRK
jgi:hypothetical protein